MRSGIRTASFFTTWIAEFLRQPMLVLTLLIGPFAILLAFGQGVDVTGVKPDVILIQDGDPTQPLQPLPEELNEYVNVVEQTDDLGGAIERLRDGEVDAVAIMPPDPETTVRGGEHIPLQMFTSEIDPLTIQFTEAYLVDQVAQLNQQTIEDAIRDAQSAVVDVEEQVRQAREYIELARSAEGNIDEVREQVNSVQTVLGPLNAATNAVVDAVSGIGFVLPGLGNPSDELEALQDEVNDLTETVNSIDEELGPTGAAGEIPTAEELDDIEAQLDSILTQVNDLQTIPPEVLSAPFSLELENVAPFEPDFTGYFSPSVLVILLQHLGISLAALSLTRIRLLGLLDMLTVAPIRSLEIVNGQYLSFGIVVGVVGASVLALMHFAVGVPVHGSWWYVAAAVLLLIGASLGVGFVVSLLTRSEQQASQIAMLILLAAVFFSGLVVSLERLAWPVKGISFALPSTYATRALQDVMLRGVLRHPEDLAALAGITVVLYGVTVLLLRRQLRPV